MGSKPPSAPDGTAPAASTVPVDAPTVARPVALPSFLPTDPPTDEATESASAAPVAPPAWNGGIKMPQGLGPGMLSDELARNVVEQVGALSLHDLSLMQVATLAAEPEIALQKSLGAFLDRIDKSESPQIFRLVSELNKAVKDEDLDGLADRILEGKAGLVDRMLGMLSRNKLAEAQAAAFESLQLLVSGKSRKLGGVLTAMEAEIETEKKKALEEARMLERLKDNYRAQFGAFLLATVFLTTFLAKARDELAEVERATAHGTYRGAMTVQEAQDKLQALESRALAVEGVFTKLPAEQLVIRQVQTATIQTVQEITTTTAGRFASIKMTLLTLHGAMGVRNLQRTAQQGAELDANLSRTRDRLIRETATTAAHAPGDNRLQQAEQIRQVTANVRELVEIAERARAANRAKFDEARTLLARARDELTGLGAVIRPDAALKP